MIDDSVKVKQVVAALKNTVHEPCNLCWEREGIYSDGVTEQGEPIWYCEVCNYKKCAKQGCDQTTLPSMNNEHNYCLDCAWAEAGY